MSLSHIMKEWLWGGLEPIPSRLLLDVLALAGLLSATLTPAVVSTSSSRATTATAAGSATSSTGTRRNFREATQYVVLFVSLAVTTILHNNNNNNASLLSPTKPSSSFSSTSSSSSSSTQHHPFVSLLFLSVVPLLLLQGLSLWGLRFALSSSSLSSCCDQKENDNEVEFQTTRTTDITTTTSSSNCTAKRIVSWNTIILLASIVGTIVSAGNVTNRWTLTLPMIPILLLQGLRRLLLLLPPRHYNRYYYYYYGNAAITLLSLVCIGMAAALCVLFPAVQLPAVPSGPYHVGVVDFFLPVQLLDFTTTTSGDAAVNCTAPHLARHHIACQESSKSQQQQQQQYLSVKLFYPTLESPLASKRISDRLWLLLFPKTIPYLDPEMAVDFCQHTMKFGAPPPLKQSGWILHTWRLTQLTGPVIAGTPPLARTKTRIPPTDISSSTTTGDNDAFPLVVYSHGLGGTANVYQYQAMSLAAAGYVVLSITHTDGSAPVVKLLHNHHNDHKYTTTRKYYDYELAKLWHQGDEVDYVRARRDMTNVRVTEFLAAVESFHQLVSSSSSSNNNDNDKSRLLPVAVPQVLVDIGLAHSNRINVAETFFMGHSFGGATVLTAAHRWSDKRVKGVVAHEPAIDWIPDDARRALFAPSQGLPQEYSGGTGGYLSLTSPITTTSDEEHSVDDNNKTTTSSNDNNNTTTSNNIHNVEMMILFSHEWKEKRWSSWYVIEEMYKAGRLGPQPSSSSSSSSPPPGEAAAQDQPEPAPTQRGRSVFGIVDQAHHSEFADTCMLTPVWLARITGVTGKHSNPTVSARHIALQTRTFLESIRT